MLDIQNRQEGNASVVTVLGAVECEVISRFRESLQAILAMQHPALLVINLEGVHFIDSSGIGFLVASQNIMEMNQGSLRLCGLGPQVREALDLVHLTTFFSIFSMEHDALRGMLPQDHSSRQLSAH